MSAISRTLVLLAILVLYGCQSQSTKSQRGAGEYARAGGSPFVTVQATRFVRAGRPYYFAGANITYDISAGTSVNSRGRLQGELDQLQMLGISNVRVVADAPSGYQSEGQADVGATHQDVLLGLDVLLDELAKRNMVAVLSLGDLWQATVGGLRQDRETEIEPLDPNPVVQKAGQFFRDEQAQRRYRAWLGTLIGRTNSINGKVYSEDPTIMSWQLSGAPATGDYERDAQLADYTRWLGKTSAYIKSLDDNHLISASSAGLNDPLRDVELYLAAYQGAGVDYLTFHAWPEQWGWFDTANTDHRVAGAVATAKAFILQHLQVAKVMGLPAVLDELVLRGDIADGKSRVEYSERQSVYSGIYAFVEQQARLGQPMTGTNFFAGSRYFRAAWSDADSGSEDPVLVDKAPRSVLQMDDEILQIIKGHAKAMSAL